MAVAFDAQGHLTAASGTTISGTPITVGSGSNRVLLVGLHWSGTAAVPTGVTVTWDVGGTNQAMTAVTGATGNDSSSGGTDSIAWYALVAPTSGTKTVTASWTGARVSTLAAISLTGANQTGGTTSFAHGTANGATTGTGTTVTITSATGNMTVALHGEDGGSTFSATSATNDFLSSTNNATAMNHTAGSASNTMTGTYSPADSSVAAGLDVVAAAGSVTDLQNMWFQPWQDPVRRKTATDLELRALAFVPVVVTPSPGPGATVAGADIRGPTFTKTVIYQVKAQTLLAKEDIPKQEWTVIWDEPVWPKRGLAAHEQQSLAWSGFTPPTAATVLGDWPDFAGRKQRPPLDTQPLAWSTFTPAATTPTGWNDPLEVPVRNWQRSPIYSAQSLAWSSTPDAIGWFSPLSEPVRIIVSPAKQQVLALAPNPIVATGWSVSLSEPARAKQRAIADYAYAPLRVSEVITIDKWYNPLAPPVLSRRRAADFSPIAFGPDPIGIQLISYVNVDSGAAGSATTPNFSLPSRADDCIIVAGTFDGNGTPSIATDKGDVAVFQTINGTITPQTGTSGNKIFVALIAHPTAGSSNVTLTITGNTFAVLNGWLVRGLTNPVLDKSVGDIADPGASTTALSGLTGTLSAPAEFAIGVVFPAATTVSIDNTQAGSALFTLNLIDSFDFGYSYEITQTNASIQSAFTITNTGFGFDCWVSTFRSGAPVPTWATWTSWPDFTLKAKAAVNYQPWTFLEPAPQVFFPYAPWDDFARRKQPSLDAQLAWSTFTPAAVVTDATTASADIAGPTFTKSLIYQVTTQPINFTAATVINTWAQWPDFAPRAKRAADFTPWTFLEPAPQVFFPYAPWDDFTRRKKPPLDTQPLAWNSLQIATAAPIMAWVRWPDFAPRARPATDAPSSVFLALVPSATTVQDWADFVLRKPPPLDTQPLIWTGQNIAAPAPTMAWVRWPDFAPKKPVPLNYDPLALVQLAPQVWFPPNITPDTAPAAKRTVEYPYLAFVAPQPPWNAWTIWPDQVPTRKKPVVDFQSWVFIEPPPQVFFPYAPWDDFTRRKPQFPDTQPIAGPINFVVEVTLVSKWFEGLSLPPGPKRGLGTYLQSSYTNDTMAAAIALFARVRWYAPLSEPVRRKGLRPEFQKFTERDLFIANFYLASLNATEQGDFLAAVLYQFNTPLLAYVDIVQNDPRQRGNLGVIENVAQSSIIASIAEPQTVPATGQPVSAVAGARVAIIIQGAGP